MRAIRVAEHGGPEVLVPTDLDDPTPGPDDVLLETAATGVNYIDTYVRTGLYPATLPVVPGSECAGVVREVGSAVTEVAVGDRVATADATGSYATLAVVLLRRTPRATTATATTPLKIPAS